MKRTPETYYIPLLGMVLGTILLSFIFREHWIAWISFGLGFIGLAVPFLGEYMIRGIVWIQHKIGKLINLILLSSVFFVVLTPLAFLKRMLGSNKTEGQLPDSHFVEVDKQFSTADFKRPW